MGFLVQEICNKHPEDLKVYYWNEVKKNWELVAGTFGNGQIKASTNHFSTFTVFNPNDLSDKKPSSETELAKTATNMYNWLFVGIIVLILGGTLFVGQRVRKREENIS